MAEKKAAKKPAEKKVEVRLLNGVGWGDGWWNIGECIMVTPQRAKFLVENGLAEKVFLK